MLLFYFSQCKRAWWLFDWCSAVSNWLGVIWRGRDVGIDFLPIASVWAYHRRSSRRKLFILNKTKLRWLVPLYDIACKKYFLIRICVSILDVTLTFVRFARVVLSWRIFPCQYRPMLERLTVEPFRSALNLYVGLLCLYCLELYFCDLVLFCVETWTRTIYFRH